MQKIVLSRTLQSDRKDITVFSENIKQHILTLKNSKGKNIVIFGSPGAVHSLMYEDLIDDYWLFINPILLGDGIPMFRHITTVTRLTLKKTKTLKNGVVCLHYKREEVE